MEDNSKDILHKADEPLIDNNKLDLLPSKTTKSSENNVQCTPFDLPDSKIIKRRRRRRNFDEFLCDESAKSSFTEVEQKTKQTMRRSPRNKVQNNNQLLSTLSNVMKDGDSINCSNTHLIAVPSGINKQRRENPQEVHLLQSISSGNSMIETSVPVEKKKRRRYTKNKIQNNEDNDPNLLLYSNQSPNINNYELPLGKTIELTNKSNVKTSKKRKRQSSFGKTKQSSDTSFSDSFNVNNNKERTSPPFYGFARSSNDIENTLISNNDDSMRLNDEKPGKNKKVKRKQSMQIRIVSDHSIEYMPAAKPLNNKQVNPKVKKSNKKQALDPKTKDIVLQENNLNLNIDSSHLLDGKSRGNKPANPKGKKGRKKQLLRIKTENINIQNESCCLPHELPSNDFNKYDGPPLSKMKRKQKKRSPKSKIENTNQHSSIHHNSSHVSDDLNNNLNESDKKQSLHVERPNYPSKAGNFIKYNNKKLIVNNRTKKNSPIKVTNNDSLVNLSRGAQFKVPIWAWETFYMQRTVAEKQNSNGAIEDTSAKNDQKQEKGKGHLKNVDKSIIKKLVDYRKGIGQFYKFGYLCKSQGLLSYGCNLFKCLKESACSCQKIPISEAEQDEIAALEESLTLYTDRYYNEKYYKNESRPVTCDEGVSIQDLEDIGVIKNCHVPLDKYNFNNMVPFCLDHLIYDCHCLNKSTTINSEQKPSFNPVSLFEYLKHDLESTDVNNERDSEDSLKISRTNIELRCLRWDAFINLCMTNKEFNVWYADSPELYSLAITLDDKPPTPSYNKITQHFRSHEFKSFRYMYWTLNKLDPQHKSLGNMWLVVGKKRRHWEIYDCTDDVNVRSGDNPYIILAGECNDNIDELLDEKAYVGVKNRNVHDQEVDFDYDSDSNSSHAVNVSKKNIEIKEDIVCNIEDEGQRDLLSNQNTLCTTDNAKHEDNGKHSENIKIKDVFSIKNKGQSDLLSNQGILYTADNAKNEDNGNKNLKNGGIESCLKGRDIKYHLVDENKRDNSTNSPTKSYNVDDNSKSKIVNSSGSQKVLVCGSVIIQIENAHKTDRTNINIEDKCKKNNVQNIENQNRNDLLNDQNIVICTVDVDDDTKRNKNNSPYVDGGNKDTYRNVNFHDYISSVDANSKNAVVDEVTIVREKEIKIEEVELLTQGIEKHFDPKKLISDEISNEGDRIRIALSVQLPSITIAGKWRVLRMRPDLAYLKFSLCNAIVKSKCIVDAICKARETKTTVLIKSSILEQRYHHSNFGIYCVHNYSNKIFIGPYLLNSSDDLEIFVNLNGTCVKASEASGPNGVLNNDYWFFQEKSSNHSYLSSDNNVQIISVIDLTYDDEDEDITNRNK
ncbi:hypothetical protein ILUMI_10536 [Ignelater luminosus]|uniref:Uncharacterized protein n=1 Tax=Ignelater luminosus TaxID=2038154 RepID=A0A8K0D340_IGNLU|nr:hypothetical protein ILUMI_10536 [Ignelater luminosus]